MIGGFKDDDTRRIFLREKSRRFNSLARIILRKLLQIEAAIALENLRSPPANHLEALRGNRAGQHSIRVNDQYRICFRWKNDQPYDVEVVDYH